MKIRNIDSYSLNELSVIPSDMNVVMLNDNKKHDGHLAMFLMRGVLFLFDAGYARVSELIDNCRLMLDNVTSVVCIISHMHVDHVSGLPSLDHYLRSRQIPLRILTGNSISHKVYDVIRLMSHEGCRIHGNVHGIAPVRANAFVECVTHYPDDGSDISVVKYEYVPIPLTHYGATHYGAALRVEISQAGAKPIIKQMFYYGDASNVSEVVTQFDEVFQPSVIDNQSFFQDDKPTILFGSAHTDEVVRTKVSHHLYSSELEEALKEHCSENVLNNVLYTPLLSHRSAKLK